LLYSVIMNNKNRLFRQIPKVDSILIDPEIVELTRSWKRSLVLDAIDATLATLRQEISESDHNELSTAALIANIPNMVVARLEQMTAPSFTRVINATGIVVHTNLGRSPLPKSAIEKMQEFATGYMTLEFDMKSGKRGQRDQGIRRLLSLLFPGHNAIVVNNNAAAVLLAMNTLSAGKQAIISRGRIIEIGDGFRINQIQEKSGAQLAEIGTTNRTHITDFEAAICEHTALLLSVHPSNYRVVGFTAEVNLGELVEIGNRHSIPVLEDWGSGCIVEPEELGIRGEESAAQLLTAKPDVICFSGDKLLGGPQAGIIVGKPEVVDKMRKNHLYRALRVDKLTLLALEEVLRLYLQGKEKNIPTIAMLSKSQSELKQRAESLTTEINNPSIVACEMSSRVGGGAAPEVDLPSYGLKISCHAGEAESLRNKLRFSKPSVIARVFDDSVLLDLRTVFVEQLPDMVAVIQNALHESR
jgi:L-seryl-tRNA(Ser) seleniumtransferase